jgi:hypothetical protein
LIAYIEELASPAFQQEVRLNDPPDTSAVYWIDGIVHFFFDDSDLAEKPSSEIGYILFDEAEAEVIKDLCNLLSRMVDELGDARSVDFLNHPLWDLVMPTAETAYALLAINGVAHFS